MDYTLKEILDIPRLRELLGSMDEIYSMPSAILDTDGNVLIATAWQDICTKFHRINPDSNKKCVESDTHIGAELDREQLHVVYRCPMGLVDAATPLIIDGMHLGNVFTGQLFMEPPEEDYFIKQAKQFGFDETEYMAAVRRVPYFPEEKLHKNLTVIHGLALMLAEQGLQNLRLRKAEAELRESEQRYRDLFIRAGEGILIMSPDGDTIELNESFAEMHGYTAAEMSEMKLVDLDTAESFYEAPERIRRIMSGEQLSFVVEHRHRDGHIFPLEVSASQISSNGVPFIQSFHRDITARRRMESFLLMEVDIIQELSVPEITPDTFRRVIAAMKFHAGCDAVGIRIKEGEGFPYAAQEGFTEEFLSSENSLVERTPNGGICRDGSGNVSLECTCGLVIGGRTDPGMPFFSEGGSFWSNDSAVLLDILPADDPRIQPRNRCIHLGYASIALIPVRAGGEIIGLLQLNDRRKGYFTDRAVLLLEGIASHIGDVLVQKRLEQEKREMERQLIQAQKLESLAVLSGGIAHDFNNIMQVIKGYCYLLKEDGAPALKKALEIEKSVERAADLCRQMLAYAGRAPFVKTRFNLKYVIADTLKVLKASICQNILIKMDSGSTIPLIAGDSGQIAQVVMNLCTNASEAIGEVQGEIHLSLSEVEITAVKPEKDWQEKAIPSGIYVCLEVSDNGCGMDPETNRRIFEPFYTTKFAGRGLGMSAVLGIVKMHGGALQFSSKPELGTTFKVYLPVGLESVEDQPLRQVLPKRSQGNGTVLLVEDEKQIRLVAGLMLERLGLTVIEAENGRDALDLYRLDPGKINLVVTDMGMPVMDGYELFSELKKICPDLPIFISSGFGDSAITSRIDKDQIAGFVSKPYSFEKMGEVVGKFISDELNNGAE